ncbi:MAG: hypothetical protein OXJ64_04185, partial [Boseongicola sp.]|nr:hypothetical protein [Boseongicola sp.]
MDETLREVGVDLPVTGLVGVGEGVAGNSAADAHVIQLSGLGAQAGLDVAQAAPAGELGKCHAPVLIRAAERLYVPVAAVPGDAPVEHAPREMSHDLGEDQAAGMHRVLLLDVAFQGGSVKAGDAGSSRQHRKGP